MWNVTANNEKKLLLIRSDSTLDIYKVQEVLHHIYIKNEGRYSSYQRLVDLSVLTDINTHFDSIRDLVKFYRITNPLEDNVKTALYMPFGVTRAILEIYCQQESLNTNRYLVSGSIDECVHFLSVEKRHRNIYAPPHINHASLQSFNQSP